MKRRNRSVHGAPLPFGLMMLPAPSEEVCRMMFCNAPGVRPYPETTPTHGHRLGGDCEP